MAVKLVAIQVTCHYDNSVHYLFNFYLNAFIFFLANNKAKKDLSQSSYMTAFLHGFKECIADATKFFQEVEELDVSEGRCHRLIQHLKTQVQQYESNEREPSKVVGDGRIWEGDDSKKTYNTSTGDGRYERLLNSFTRSFLKAISLTSTFVLHLTG